MSNTPENIERLERELAEVKAECERLRLAGDALADLALVEWGTGCYALQEWSKRKGATHG